MATHSSVTFVALEAFGPVKRAQMVLGDVTVFFGPPNTGKSYVAKAVYALVRSFEYAAVGLTEEERHRAAEALGLRPLEVGEARVEVSASARDLSGLLKSALERGLRRAFEEAFGAYGERLLAGSAVAAASGDVRLSAVGGRVELEGFEEVVSLAVKVTRRGPVAAMEAEDPQVGWGHVHLIAERLDPGRASAYTIDTLSDAVLYAASMRPDPYAGKSFADFVVEKIDGREMSAHVANMAVAVLLHRAAHRLFGAVTALFVPHGRAALTLMPLGMQLPGYLANYLRVYHAMARSGRGLLELLRDPEAAALAAAALQGDVRPLHPGAPRLAYLDRQRGAEVDLYNASATAAELAGMLLPLARGPDLAVVEEPEAHLHPSRQRLAAWILATLAHSTRLIVTTHSDFLVTELALMAGLKNVDDEKALDAMKALLGELGREHLETLLRRARRIYIKFYYFDEGGEPREVAAADVVTSIPSMIEQIRAQLHALRILGE